MPIEFHCTACNQLLRVPDDAAGRRAKCPGCDAVLEIPAAATRPTPAEPTLGPIIGGTASPDRDRPFPLPGAETVYQPSMGVADGPIVPTKIELGVVLSESWRIFKGQMGLIIGAIVIVMLINWGYGAITEVLGIMLVESMGNAAIPAVFFMELFGQVLLIFIEIGQAMLILNIVRGKDASLNNLFQGGPYLLRVIGISIIYGLMVVLGTLALIVPGIILALMFGEYYLLIIDKNVAAMDSLSLSRQITSGNKGTLFLLGIVMFVLIIVGLLMLLVGVLFTGAYCAVIVTVAYRMMAGLPIAGDHSTYAG